ncbi:hypothetical protein SUGI_0550960 [Cryptomeria japonica]|nr:hypothetical protein SUGI_0550960 [Cryptomeria japonica]
MAKRNREEEGEGEGEAAAKTKRPRIAVESKTEHGNTLRHRATGGDFWKEIFLVGTEWKCMDDVYKMNWDFSNLEDAFEEGSALYGKNVYLFGLTEGQIFPHQGMIHIPVIVAVVSPFAPSDKIGYTSYRMGQRVVPMKDMNMCWVPYIPYNKRHLPLEQLQIQSHILKCTQRRAALKQVHEDRIYEYNYCLPYFYHPFKKDPDEDYTEVPIVYPLDEGQPIADSFNWKTEKFEEFIANQEVPDDKVQDFENFVRQRVMEDKSKYDEAMKARKKARTPVTEAAFKEVQVYKCYPVQPSNTPDFYKIKKVPCVSRYYGNADEYL